MTAYNEMSYPQVLEERIASMNAKIKDCQDDDERIALYQTREDLEEELRFAWAELEEEASKPIDLETRWNRDSVLEFAAENGNEQAAALLLLAGPDYYDGADYDELLALLETGEWELGAFLTECEEYSRNPYSYDYRHMPAGKCNGHEVKPYPRSLAAIIVDGGIVNMGVINERYPQGSVEFVVNNKGMTGIEYVRYLLEK